MRDRRFVIRDDYPAVFSFIDTKDGLAVHVSKWLNMPLFKFAKKKYVDDFFETGRLRIGTLFDYHRIEEHGSFRGDAREGLMKYIDPNGETSELSSQNNWMFCMSRSLDESLKLEFGGDGYQINNLRFFHEITRALRLELKALTSPAMIADVRYVDSNTPMPAGSEHRRYAGARKDMAKYAYQNEARIMWETYPRLPPRYVSGPEDVVREKMREFIAEEMVRVPIKDIVAPAAIPFCTRL